MRIGRSNRQQDEITVDLTPMLDVVFIMLIFFIVSSTFVRPTAMNIQRPDAQSGVSMPIKSLIITISASNQYYFGDKPVNHDDLMTLLNGHHLLNDQSRLIIDADKQAQNWVVVQVIDMAKSVGIEYVALATDTP
jgi:biopolymer transport protein ExbD